MRPSILNPLFAPVTGLEGVGPKIASLLSRLLDGPESSVPRVVDLLFHLPSGVIDRTRQPGIARSPEGGVVTLKVRVDRHQPTRNRPGVPYRVFVHDDTGELALSLQYNRLARGRSGRRHGSRCGVVEWFNAGCRWFILTVLRERDFRRAAADRARLFHDRRAGAEDDPEGGVECAMAMPKLPEWILRRGSLPRTGLTLPARSNAHRPQSPADLDPRSPHRTRLASTSCWPTS
jgi:ATP-dependent DNA helicase RecG